MKKLALSLIVCLSAMVGAKAQVIVQNDGFWDGDHILVANVQKSGLVTLKGRNLDNEHISLTLKKSEKVKGEYTLQKGEGEAPYGCKWGCKVKYIRQGDTKFLAFYVDDNTIGQAVVMTTDNLINNTDQQACAEEEDPLSIISSRLLNQHHLGRIHPEMLQTMANDLRARQKRTIVEQTNLQMINYFISSGRAASDIEGDGCEEDAMQQNPELNKIINVRNADEFVAALGSNRTVQIADGATLYLTDLLNTKEFFEKPGRAWRGEYYPERTGAEELAVSCQRYDGRQLDIVNMHNLTIKGGKSSSIIISPRYACVLNFYGCSGIRIENLTLGHTEEGYCEGSVVYVEGCEDITIADCDLYGCGTYGIEGNKNNGLVMERSIIRDCSYGIMCLRGCQSFTFRNCDFYRCRDANLIDTDEACLFLSFENCRFAQNQGDLFANRGEVTLSGCKIYHTYPNGSGYGLLQYKGKNTSWDISDKPLTERVIGPRK